VHDNDDAGFVVAPTSLEVSEPAGTATFTVSLASEPTAPVVVPVAASNGQCQVSAASVTLTAGNWQQGVSVTVSAVDDDVADGDQQCTILSGPTTSAAADYALSLHDALPVLVHDNDDAGFVVAPTSLEVSEPAGTATFTVS